MNHDIMTLGPFRLLHSCRGPHEARQWIKVEISISKLTSVYQLFILFLCSCRGEIDNRSWNIEETWQIGEVETIFAKDDYNSETHENDIAILRL